MKSLAEVREAWLATVQRIMPDDCWNWPWAKMPAGYGVVRKGGRQQMAHRVMYEDIVGPIPEGLTIDHLCSNPSCVNPLHLEPVTMHENLLRGRSFAGLNAKKTHCPAGHAYDEVNTLHCADRRFCRTCLRERDRARRARVKSTPREISLSGLKCAP